MYLTAVQQRMNCPTAGKALYTMKRLLRRFDSEQPLHAVKVSVCCGPGDLPGRREAMPKARKADRGSVQFKWISYKESVNFGNVLFRQKSLCQKSIIPSLRSLSSSVEREVRSTYR